MPNGFQAFQPYCHLIKENIPDVVIYTLPKITTINLKQNSNQNHIPKASKFYYQILLLNKSEPLDIKNGRI